MFLERSLSRLSSLCQCWIIMVFEKHQKWYSQARIVFGNLLKKKWRPRALSWDHWYFSFGLEWCLLCVSKPGACFGTCAIYRNLANCYLKQIWKKKIFFLHINSWFLEKKFLLDKLSSVVSHVCRKLYRYSLKLHINEMGEKMWENYFNFILSKNKNCATVMKSFCFRL